MLKKLLSLLLVCTFLLSGCQKEAENHYLGNLHLSYQLKGENNQKEYEFFYGYAFRKYLAQVQNALGDDNANVLPFQLNDNINSLKDQKCTIEGYQEQSWEGYFAKQALEYYKETGKKLSEHNEEQRQKESPYNFAYFVLYHDREELYDRINRRVDLMMEEGLLFEVESLIKEGYTKNLVSMQGLGYKEFFDYFDGRMTLEDTVDKIKKDTRHFAKRQLTWFRREKEVIWLNKKEYEQEKDLLDSVLNIIEEKGIRNGTKR